MCMCDVHVHAGVEVKFDFELSVSVLQERDFQRIDTLTGNEAKKAKVSCTYIQDSPSSTLSLLQYCFSRV